MFQIQSISSITLPTVLTRPGLSCCLGSLKIIMLLIVPLGTLSLFVSGPGSSFGQDVELTVEQKRNYENFERQLTNVKLVGSFTELSRSTTELKEEEYTIEKVSKAEDGDQWIIHARIKFDEYDFAAPLPLDVLWAGDTPVISLTNLTIPTLGTFSARVLFHDGKYSGTWSHGEKGGHLFGRIVRIEESESSPDDEPDDH